MCTGLWYHFINMKENHFMIALQISCNLLHMDSTLQQKQIAKQTLAGTFSKVPDFDCWLKRFNIYIVVL